MSSSESFCGWFGPRYSSSSSFPESEAFEESDSSDPETPKQSKASMLELKLVQEPLRLHLRLGRSILKVCNISLQYSSWLSFESLQIHFPFFFRHPSHQVRFPQPQEGKLFFGGGGGVGGQEERWEKEVEKWGLEPPGDCCQYWANPSHGLGSWNLLKKGQTFFENEGSLFLCKERRCGCKKECKKRKIALHFKSPAKAK